jgi:hypothetical protein
MTALLEAVEEALEEARKVRDRLRRLAEAPD